jgi:hypothetical protein
MLFGDILFLALEEHAHIPLQQIELPLQVDVAADD